MEQDNHKAPQDMPYLVELCDYLATFLVAPEVSHIPCSPQVALSGFCVLWNVCDSFVLHIRYGHAKAISHTSLFCTGRPVRILCFLERLRQCCPFGPFGALEHIQVVENGTSSAA